MKKKVIILTIILFMIACFCWKGKTEFVQSKIRSNLFLIKNPPKIVPHFTEIDFYRYSWNNKYFLDHEEDSGGFSSEELINYPEDNLANYIVSKCKNDSTKLVGKLFMKDPFKPDTIIYKCD